jgi:hypothetical protein
VARLALPQLRCPEARPGAAEQPVGERAARAWREAGEALGPARSGRAGCARRGDIGTVEAENVVDGRVLVRMDWAPEGATERWWLKDREVEAI